MPRQITAKQLNRAIQAPGSTTGQRASPIKCPGCKRRSGADDNIQNLKKIRMKFGDLGLLAEPTDNMTANDDALGILSSMGCGIVTKAPKSPNPRTPVETAVPYDVNTSLLQLETDTTSIPNAKIFDSVSFHKKEGEPYMVPMNELFKPPTELSGTQRSNIFKPDDNPTDIEKKRKLNVRKKQTPNVVKLANEIIDQQQRLRKRPKLMIPNFKIAYGAQGG